MRIKEWNNGRFPKPIRNSGSGDDVNNKESQVVTGHTSLTHSNRNEGSESGLGNLPLVSHH